MNVFVQIAAALTLGGLLSTITGDESPVKIVGTLRAIHRDGDAMPKVRLDTVARKNTYGLGPAAFLKGEVVIIDGRVYTTRVGQESLETTTDNSTQAAMLVWQHVAAWKPAFLVNRAVSLDSLGAIVQSQLPAGTSRTQPTMFIVDGVVESLEWHVVDWPDDVPIEPGSHLKFAYRDTTRSELVRCIGVWHPSGAGLVTHHDANVHLHALLGPDTVAVHVEAVRFAPGAMVMVPRN